MYCNGFYVVFMIVRIVFVASQSAQMKRPEIRFVVDFIQSHNSPNKVLENLCWDQDSKFRLYSELTTNNIHFLTYKFENSSQLLTTLLYEKYFALTILTDLNCKFNDFFEQAIKHDLLVFPNVWIVFDAFSLQDKLNYYIPINSLFILPKYKECSKNWQVISFYKTNSRLKKYMQNVFGTWSLEDGLDMTGPILLTRNRSNFMGMPLRVSYVFSQPTSFEHIDDYREKHKDNWTKINIILLQYITDFWNATHIRIYRNDWGFKFIHPSKFFTKGLFGDLLYGRADVGGTGSFMRLQHFKYFFVSSHDFSMSFIFRAPPLAFYSNLFYLPFVRSVWIVFGLLIILGGILIGIIFKWEEYVEIFSVQAKQSEENFPKILDVIMMQLAIVCQMDFFYEPKSVSGKVLTFVVLMSSTFVYTAFSARIVLLLQSTTTSIKNMGDLYEAGYDFGVEDHLFNKYYFRGLSNRTNEHWRKIIYENKIKSPTGYENFLPADEGIRRVREGYFAFHVQHEAAFSLIQETFTNEEKCAVNIVDTIFKSDIPYLSVLKNSTYVEFLLVGVRRLAESGLHVREARRCYAKKPKCQGTGNYFVSVGIIECYFAIMTFAIGFALSLSIFITELLTAYYIKFRAR